MKKFMKLLVMTLIIMLAIPTMASAKTKQPKEVAKSYFAYAKKTDIKKVNSLTYENNFKVDAKQIKSVPSLMNYIKKYNKKMKVKVVSQKVKGNNATVKIKATYVNSEEISSTFLGLALIYAISPEAQTDSEEVQMKKLDELFNSAVAMCGKPKMQTKTMNIKLTKKKGKWLVNDTKAYKIATADLYMDN
ncbi:MAG: hypothetical protein Q4D51_07740 [Eubacteriales bacterium]|nr:hypothetical protein [Eubacteriales bacterium]